ncbi:MAG: uncharacterized protein JWN04_577 [Myxococcaceae bacterium]|nr:uncharacterized protein [Myxococcaceae bacterium]
MTTEKTGRNDPCHCGSGLKYKKCHATADDAARSAELSAQAAARAASAAAAAAAAAEAGEEQPVVTKGGKSAPQQHGGGVSQARVQRPKLPAAHTSNLPRRGAV